MRKKIAGFCVLAILTLCASCAKEEYEHFGSINGTVTDFSNGAPVSNANIVLNPSGKTVLTGSNGFYEFVNLEPGQYTVTAQHSAYKTDRMTVTVRVGEGAAVNFSLVKE